MTMPGVYPGRGRVYPGWCGLGWAWRVLYRYPPGTSRTLYLTYLRLKALPTAK